MGDDQTILVVEKDLLFGNGNDYFQGFRKAGQVDYERRILEGRRWMWRGIAEENQHFKQPIPYAMIVNPFEQKVFAFKRAKKGKYDEKRLQDKWSWGVGGHVEPSDQAENPLEAGFLREIGEEVEIVGTIIGKSVVGYINDDLDDVGKVHFGLLYVVETNGILITPKDPEIAEGRLMDVSELSQMCEAADIIVENWSRIALNPLEAYLRQAS